MPELRAVYPADLWHLGRHHRKSSASGYEATTPREATWLPAPLQQGEARYFPHDFTVGNAYQLAREVGRGLEATGVIIH